jgi:anti-anti-sigma regulatory factor
MQFKLTPNEQESHLTLDGELTLLHADRLKVELTSALDSFQRVVIDTQGLSAIDLACLQLFCSAHQSALSRGKELIFNQQQSEIFRKQIDQAGLIGAQHCSRQRGSDCLWNGGDR